MINKLSIRVRLVLMTMFILTLCCIGLTLIINYSATQMASQIAKETIPAQSINASENVVDSQLAPSDAINIGESVNNQKKAIDVFYKNSMLYMLFIITIGGVMMYFFSKKILQPLTTLNEKVKSRTISNLSEKMNVPDTGDEINELAISFNKMTDRIQESFLFQQQFSANVAHELRTPLTILKTKIEVFHKKERTVVEYQNLISNLENQVFRLSDIVQTLLELTNTDCVHEKECISVSDMIENILKELINISEKRNIKFVTDFKDIEMYGNIDLLYQVFYNLIQNSINYNVESGSVYISAEKRNQKTLISICDTGIGIPKKQQQRIFEPFYRIDESRSRSIGGAGLGLFIVKNIIDKHNGIITVSDNKRQGTCFTIELPF